MTKSQHMTFAAFAGQGHIAKYPIAHLLIRPMIASTVTGETQQIFDDLPSFHAALAAAEETGTEVTVSWGTFAITEPDNAGRIHAVQLGCAEWKEVALAEFQSLLGPMQEASDLISRGKAKDAQALLDQFISKSLEALSTMMPAPTTAGTKHSRYARIKADIVSAWKGLIDWPDAASTVWNELAAVIRRR